MKIKNITAKYIFDGNNLLENKLLQIQNNTIFAIKEYTTDTKDVINLGDGVISPGFIDLQLNGCGGVLFNDDISFDALQIMYDTCLKFGTTSFLPTLITTTLDDIKKALDIVDKWIKTYGMHKGVVGIHLEGPYISHQKHGIHNDTYIINPKDEDLLYIAEYAHKFPVKLTIAPEVFTIEQITQLKNKGVILSIGHSNADYKTAKNAIDSGVKTATHVFNAMSGLLGRHPGVVGAIMNSGCYGGVIADLMHVDAANIELLHKIKKDKLYIVTDAVTPLGVNIAKFKFADKTIFVSDKKCIDVNGTLAGANISMPESIKNCVTACNISLLDALKMAISIPAKVINLHNSFTQLKSLSIEIAIYTDLTTFECTPLSKYFKHNCN